MLIYSYNKSTFVNFRGITGSTKTRIDISKLEFDGRTEPMTNCDNKFSRLVSIDIIIKKMNLICKKKVSCQLVCAD